MPVNAPDVEEVLATREEIDAWRVKYPRRHSTPYRVACRYCGKRMWLSGIGIGAHRRVCKQTNPTEVKNIARRAAGPSERQKAHDARKLKATTVADLADDADLLNTIAAHEEAARAAYSLYVAHTSRVVELRASR